MRRSSIGIALLAVAASLGPEIRFAAAELPQVPLWGRWEAAFQAEAAAQPDLDFTAELVSPQGERRQVPGFWDADRTWRLRFMPDQAGLWKCTTHSQPAIPGLDNRTGSFQCVVQPSDNRFLRHGPLRVVPGQPYLTHADRTPFFWLGDTVWTGPALSSEADWETYLQDRRQKQFTVVQYNATAPWRVIQTDAEGHPAFTGRNPIQIDPLFFRRLDARLEAANRHGLAGAHVLIWSNSTKDPGRFLDESDLLRLARYQLARYAAFHLVWILAGDDRYTQSAAMWQRIGRQLFGAGAHAPVTTHPTGMNWPWKDWSGEPWLDFLGYQSGHGDGPKTWQWLHSGPVAQSWQNFGGRPIINLEPPYEDHLAYQSRQPHNACNVRRAAWWSVLITPPAGLTYGAHGLWSWQSASGQVPADHARSGEAKSWRQAMDLPGSQQMRHLAALLTSLDWWRLRPAQGLLRDQPSQQDPERFVAVAASATCDLVVAYLPAGGSIRLEPRKIASLQARWYNPRSGEWGGKAPVPSSALLEAPDQEDWVLVLQP